MDTIDDVCLFAFCWCRSRFIQTDNQYIFGNRMMQLGNKSDIDGHATVDELIRALWVLPCLSFVIFYRLPRTIWFRVLSSISFWWFSLDQSLNKSMRCSYRSYVLHPTLSSLSFNSYSTQYHDAKYWLIIYSRQLDKIQGRTVSVSTRHRSCFLTYRVWMFADGLVSRCRIRVGPRDGMCSVIRYVAF